MQGNKLPVLFWLSGLTCTDENFMQKSGIQKSELIEFYNYCKKIELNIIGLMCIPPEMEDTNQYFKEMKNLSESINLQHLSMGMSSDYINAAQNLSTYLRIGTNIFGKRNS